MWLLGFFLRISCTIFLKVRFDYARKETSRRSAINYVICTAIWLTAPATFGLLNIPLYIFELFLKKKILSFLLQPQAFLKSGPFGCVTCFAYLVLAANGPIFCQSLTVFISQTKSISKNCEPWNGLYFLRLQKNASFRWRERMWCYLYYCHASKVWYRSELTTWIERFLSIKE